MSSKDIALAIIESSDKERVGIRVFTQSEGTYKDIPLDAVANENYWNLSIRDSSFESKFCSINDFPVLIPDTGFTGSLFSGDVKFKVRNAGGWVLGKHSDGRLKSVSISGQIKNTTAEAALGFHRRHKFANAEETEDSILTGKNGREFDEIEGNGLRQGSKNAIILADTAVSGSGDSDDVYYEYEGQRFVWSKRKYDINVRKHKIGKRGPGITFEEAATVFLADYFEAYDKAHSVNEDRYIAIGFSRAYNRLFVCYCARENGNLIRIFSAREADKAEWQIYLNAR